MRLSRGWVTAFFLLVVTLCCVCAVDYIRFVILQREGRSLSYEHVRAYTTSPLTHTDGVRWNFLGNLDVSCVDAVLPHQGMPPCWWVRLHRKRWA